MNLSASLTTLTAKGLFWTMGSQAIRQVVQFGFSVALARLLFPEDFGLFAMVAAVTVFLALFADLGFGHALIQRPEVTETDRSTAFWTLALASAGVSSALVVAAPLLASLLSEARLVPIFRVLSVNVFLGAASAVPRSILQREMRFGPLAVVQTTALVVSGSGAVAAAIAGLGVWSLVMQAILLNVATLVGLLVATGWWPRLRIDRQSARGLWSYGRGLLAFWTIDHWGHHADDVIVGRVIGPDPLGLYSRAFGLMSLIVSNLTNTIAPVMFPALSRTRRQPTRMRDGFLRTVRGVAYIAFPLVAGLFILADEAVVAVYGPRWAGVAPILRWFCGVGLVLAIDTTATWIFMATSRNDVLWRWGAADTIVGIVGFIVGASWGVQGVAAAYLGRVLLMSYPKLKLAGRLIDIEPADVVRQVVTPAGLALVMAVPVAALSRASASWPDVAIVLSSAAAGAVTYLGVSHLFKPAAYRDLVQLTRRWNHDRRSSSVSAPNSSDG